MRGSAGASDDHLQATALRAGCVFEHQVRRTVRRNDARLERHAQRGQGLSGVREGFPVRSANP